MNELKDVGTPLGKIGTALRASVEDLNVSKAINGWVITHHGSIWVAKTWNEMTDKLKELFQVIA